MALTYILAEDGRTPILEPDVLAWARQFETMDRKVGYEQIGPYTVSTVFLGIDHNFGGQPPPILWETMIFGGGSWDEIQQQRYTSYEEALHGHKETVRAVRKAVAG